MEEPIYTAIQIIVQHCKEIQRSFLATLVACPVDLNTHEEEDRKYLAAEAYTDQFRRLLRIVGGAVRFRNFRQRYISAGIKYSLDYAN